MNVFAKILIITLIAVFLEISLCSDEIDGTWNDKHPIGWFSKYESNISLNFSGLHQDLTMKLSSALTDLKNNFTVKYLIFLLFFSFIFGAIHALGPGHGKTLVSAYFLNQDRTIFSALKIGVIVAFTHSGSAIILGLLFGLVIRATGMEQANIRDYFSIIIGVLITFLGLFYLLSRIPKAEDKFHTFQHLKSDSVTAVLSGIVPCPVGMTIILSSIYLGILFLGLLAVIAHSIGVATTISIVGIITIKFKKSLIKFLTRKYFSISIAQNLLGIIGAVVIILLGFLMVLAKL